MPPRQGAETQGWTGEAAGILHPAPAARAKCPPHPPSASSPTSLTAKPTSGQGASRGPAAESHKDRKYPPAAFRSRVLLSLRPPRPVLLLSFRGSVPQPPIPSPLSPVRATPPCALLSTPLSFTWPRLSETQGSFRDLRCQVLFSASLLVLAMKAGREHLRTLLRLCAPGNPRGLSLDHRCLYH